MTIPPPSLLPRLHADTGSGANEYGHEVDERSEFRGQILARGPLARLLGGLRRRGLAEAPAQRLHQIDDLAGGGAILFRDRLAGALPIDEVDRRRFVVVLELLRLEPAGLLVDDVFGQSSMSFVTLTSWISSKYSSSERTS
jgi:hypothetical protein